MNGKRDVEDTGQNGNNSWNKVLKEMGNSTSGWITLASFSVMGGERLYIQMSVNYNSWGGNNVERFYIQYGGTDHHFLAKAQGNYFGSLL